MSDENEIEFREVEPYVKSEVYAADKARFRLHTASQALFEWGSTEDIEAAAQLIAKVAAKAMRRKA